MLAQTLVATLSMMALVGGETSFRLGSLQGENRGEEDKGVEDGGPPRLFCIIEQAAACLGLCDGTTA